MTTTNLSTALLHELQARLQQRRSELREILQGQVRREQAPDVRDFKDVADAESRAAIDDATHAHAATELMEVAAALRRIDDGTYGSCEACGDVLDARRLHAMPAARFCTACRQEQEGAASRH